MSGGGGGGGKRDIPGGNTSGCKVGIKAGPGTGGLGGGGGGTILEKSLVVGGLLASESDGVTSVSLFMGFGGIPGGGGGGGSIGDT